MSTRSGKTTQRTKVESYKGFSIIKVKAIEYWKPSYSQFYTNIPNKTEIHYDFCKEGEETRPSQAYECWASNIAECKECIDNFIKDDSIYFTKEEREKYVYKPNQKCQWAYGYDSLMKIMREHQKASKRMKILLEDRLEDANFHAECGYLANHDYEGFEAFVTKNYTFNEKFEVYTMTQRKRIKDPKRLEAHIQSAIEEYFKEHNMDVGNTSVKVKFCEEW